MTKIEDHKVTVGELSDSELDSANGGSRFGLATKSACFPPIGTLAACFPPIGTLTACFPPIGT
jgi:hypothetical protein